MAAWPGGTGRRNIGLSIRTAGDHAAGELAAAIELCKFRQFLFFRQWHRLRDYAHAFGVRLIGDMPIFIASDSADVWSRPELFQLDNESAANVRGGRAARLFLETGQLWGNPLYDWPQTPPDGLCLVDRAAGRAR